MLKQLVSELNKKNLLFGLIFFMLDATIFAFMSISKYISYFKEDHAKYYKPCDTCVDLTIYLDRVLSDYGIPKIKEFIFILFLMTLSLFIIYIGILVIIKVISMVFDINDNKTICKVVAYLFFLFLSIPIICLYINSINTYVYRIDNPFDIFIKNYASMFILSFFIANGWLSIRLYNLLIFEKKNYCNN